MIELQVNDMTCGHCEKAVTRAIQALDPQAKVDVDLASKRVRADTHVAVPEVIRALDDAGYPAQPVAAPAARAARAGGCGCGCH